MKNKQRFLINLLVIMGFVSILTISCKKDDDNSNPPPVNTVKDIDGNVYHTVTIGTQVWMVENLKVKHYRNGDSIQNIYNGGTWNSLSTGALCFYNNVADNSTIYGNLYNFYAVADSRKLCPAGWHVPNDAEWITLFDYLGGESVAGGKLKESGIVHWNTPNTGATNEAGFTAVPGGYRINNSNGDFSYLKFNAFLWSSTEIDNSNASGCRMSYNTINIEAASSHDKKKGFSVRCIKD